MKKLLTFISIITICFLATPVFAYGVYSGSCTCSHDRGVLPDEAGICDSSNGCLCNTYGFSPSATKNNCKPGANNHDNDVGNSGGISIGDSNVDCGIIADITRPAVRLILIAAPIILIVMGGVDILGVVTSGDEKGMKKAWSNLVKRFIICVVIFLLPLLINFIIGWTTFDDLTACM